MAAIKELLTRALGKGNQTINVNFAAATLFWSAFIRLITAVGASSAGRAITSLPCNEAP